MANADLLIDILSDLEQRSALDAQSSIDELLASDSELQEQLASDPELASEVRRALAALRDLDNYLGQHGAAGKQVLPTIPGYAIESELGFGGMGTVYKAQQESLKRPVAVKVIWKHGLRSHQYDKRVRAEAEMVARLEHPHIVQIYETGETPTAHFLVLEYMSAGNLADRLDGRPQPERLSTEIMYTIARTVEYAHSRGIIHRDLKPSNILQATDGSLKIADFGLAKMQDVESNLTASGEALGTPGYMAPEQTRGKYSERTDIYALGAILYELLTGRPPFSGETAAETLVQVQTREPIAPRLIRTKLSADLEAICLKCLEKDPARRYASAAELADDLGRFMAGKPTSARPMSSPQKLVRWAQRQPLAAGLIAGILLLLFAVTAISTVSAVWVNRSRREAESIAHRETAARSEATDLRLQSEQSVRDLQARDRKLWREVYAANVRRAFAAYTAGDLRRVHAILDETMPGREQDDLRGFEWYFLQHELNQAGHRLLVPRGGRCFFVTYSPDGRFLLAGTEEGFVTIWDAATFAQIHCWKAHEKCVNMIRFSPDAQLMATTSCDKTTRFWRATDWQPASEPMHSAQPILRCAFTPDGTRFITSSTTRQLPPGTLSEITIWDVANTKSLTTLRTPLGPITDLELALEGRRLLGITESCEVVEWDLVNDELTTAEHHLADEITGGGFGALALASDRRTIVYSSPPGGIEIADAQDNVARSWRCSNFDAERLAISHDGQHVAVYATTMASIRRMRDGSVVDSVRGISGIYWLCFSPDDRNLVSASHEGLVYVTELFAPTRSAQPCALPKAVGRQLIAHQANYQLNLTGTHLWHKNLASLVQVDLATGQSVNKFANCLEGEILSWEVAPDEITAAISTTVRGINHYYLLGCDPGESRGRIIAEFDSEFSPRFDRQSAQLATFAAGRLSIRNAKDGSMLQSAIAPAGLTIPSVPLKNERFERGRLAWIADGDGVVLPLLPDCMRFDTISNEWVRITARASITDAGDEGPRMMVSRGWPGEVTILDGLTGQSIREFRPLNSNFSLSPDGKRLATITSRGLQLTDVDSGNELFEFHPEVAPHSVHFSPDGCRLVLVGSPNSNGEATCWSFIADPPD